MGNEQSSSAPSNEELFAASMSVALDRVVVTQAEYSRRQHEPLFASVERLESIRKVSDTVYKPAKGRFGDIYGGLDGSNGKLITVYVQKANGAKVEIIIGKNSYVEELKYLLEEKEGIPIACDRLAMVFNKKQMDDDKKLSDYEIGDKSVICCTITMDAGAPVPLVLDSKLLAPEYDYDFTNMTDDGTKYERGGYPYSRPYGWKRIALKVKGEYEDDIWLGEGGTRTEASSDEWPVSYHGTAKDNVDGIARKGYLLSKGSRFAYGIGIYSAPSIETASAYAQILECGGKKYIFVFQNRVSRTSMKTVSSKTTGIAEYWVQQDEKLIRPYGLCIKEI